ncbi:MAG: MFS transporter [Promethearchaeota archaeon]
MILSKRSIILILASVLIANTTGMGVFAYAPRYLLNLGVDVIVIQLILTFFIFTTLAFPPLVGKLSDKIQHRSMLFKLGAVGVSIIFFILTTVLNLFLIVVLMILYGFFSTFANLKFVLYGELVENDHRFIAYFAAITALGWFLGAFLTGVFVEIFGIDRYFQFLLLVSLINLVIIMFIKENRALILERHEKVTIENLENTILNDRDETNHISRSIYPSLFFRNFGVRPILLILAILMFYHLSSDTEIGFLIGINYLIQFFLNIILAHIITEKNLKWIMVIGYILSAITIFAWILATDFWSFLICQILVALSFAMFMTATQIYVTKNTTPHNKGKYVGYMNTGTQLGSFSGGIMFSLLLVLYSGNYYPAMYFMIIFPAISALIILVKFESKSD